MRINVKRVTKERFAKIIDDLGPKIEFIEVPATVPGVLFQGIRSTKTEALVEWPIDRPMEAQIAFAKKYLFGGQPVDWFEKKIERGHLYLLDGNEEIH